ncbi:MAG: EAL domain-containing protein [Sulfuritalea sp.]|jgi:diguanylate cyclase (GGDEF)-like protein|nr:EAL domain-containing protein [Sulfuritalea sp.]
MRPRTRRLLLLTSRELLRGFLRRNTRWLSRLSFIGIPVVLAGVMLLALFAWESDSAVREPAGLPFGAMAFVPDDGQMQPAEARQALRGVRPVTSFDTQLSEAPVWFAFTPPVLASDAVGPPLLYFPSRHARTLACWHGAALAPLGTVTRSAVSGAFTVANSGFATTGIDLSGAPIICRATFVGPARLSVTAWTAADFDQALRSFATDMGLLEGGLTVLAVFMLLAALVNREPLYVVFAAWLIVNARLGANSTGWDMVWLGHQVPSAWLDGMRKMIFASNFPLTVYLFTRLFQVDLRKVGNRTLLNVLELLYLPMFAAALLLPYRHFLPVLWIGAFVGYGIIVYLLARILLVSQSRIALWFTASLVVTAVAGFAEVIKAMFGLPGPIPYVNSVTAALSSGLLVAIALAEQMRSERSGREEAEGALRKTYDQVPVAFFTADATGQILRGNPALGRLLGQQTLDGKARWQKLFEPGTWESIRSTLAESPRAQLRFQSITQDAWYEVRASIGDGLIEGSIEDITESVTANRKLMYLADHDQLTGALSRRAIEQALRGAIRSARPQTPATLAYMDLDRFKTINDLFGHTAGDEVLRQFCACVVKSLGGDHLLGRIGGDEFLILFNGLSLAEAGAKCRELVDQIDGSSFRVQDLAFRIGVSFGAVEVTAGLDVTDLISAADRACREAKRNFIVGHVVTYGADAPAFQEHEEERALVARLTPEQAPKFLAIAMQPIMSLSDPFGALDFEVLLRARAPDGTVMPAARVIAVAEAHGRVGVIDRWVLREVLEWLDTNLAQLTTTRFVTMNFSGASINDEQFMADAYAMLRAHPRAASRLCAEITEGVALRDFGQTRRVIERLRELDVKLALDDFGAGYTSFMYLSDLQADVIKIDGAIVESAARHPSRLSIVQAISDLSRNLGMRSIAEWVEDAATLRAMAEVGIDYIQGFGIAKPMAPAEILLGRHAAHWISDPAMRTALVEIQTNRTVVDDGVTFSTGKSLH